MGKYWLHQLRFEVDCQFWRKRLRVAVSCPTQYVKSTHSHKEKVNLLDVVEIPYVADIRSPFEGCRPFGSVAYLAVDGSQPDCSCHGCCKVSRAASVAGTADSCLAGHLVDSTSLESSAQAMAYRMAATVGKRDRDHSVARSCDPCCLHQIALSVKTCVAHAKAYQDLVD